MTDKKYTDVKEIDIMRGGNLNFGPFVSNYKVHEELLDGLLQRGEKCRPGSGNSNLAGIMEDQRGYSQEDKKWFIEHFQPYITSYVEDSARYSGQVMDYRDGKFSTSFTLIDLWINYMKENEQNPEHSHGGMLSWVIFLKVPDLEEERKNYKGKSYGPGGVTFHYGEHQNPTWAQHSYGYFPEVAGMWIFPAQLRHHVMSYKTPGERISVSGNLYFNPPNVPSKTYEAENLQRQNMDFARKVASEIK
tara:strand:+ start:1852 stop:2592 length:741 start_codon:yes stop_codon:yes gene_type:complete